MKLKILALSLCLCLALPAGANTPPAENGYKTPHPALQAIAEAPLTPHSRLGPLGGTLLMIKRPGLPAIADVAQPTLRLAGLRLNAAMRAEARFSFGNSLMLISVANGSERPVLGLPADARIAEAHFSPDERWVAVTLWESGGVKLWLVDVKQATARRLITPSLNATQPGPVQWLAGSNRLLVRLVPSTQGPQPQAPTVPTGPKTEESLGGKVAQTRTYPDLLKTPYDSDLLDWALDSQLAAVSLDGKIELLGQHDRLLAAVPSPDGRYLLVKRLRRPYSTLVPLERFPETTELWDMKGQLVKVVHERPLIDRLPSGYDAVPTGPRDIGWRADAPATLFWAEAQDGGDPSVSTTVRDAVFLQSAPFKSGPQRWLSLANRLSEIQWGSDDLALVSEYWWKSRDVKTWQVRPGKPADTPQLLFARKSEDRYADPGSPMTKTLSNGVTVLNTGADGKSLFLAGEGASNEGDRPFLDHFDLSTRKTTRLWRSEAPFYEEALALLDDSGRRFISRREAREEFPNFYVRDLPAGQLRALTRLPNPLPQLKGIQVQTLRYKRADGLELSGKLYLPPGYDQKRDGALPLLMWAYPQSFKTKEAAAQVTDSPYRYNRISPLSPLTALARGYAVLDDPAMPIIGEGKKEPNDTYLEQLTASAKAAVDEVVRLGVADRNRIAVGGHSYGAFMTANLLAHTRLFRAGIARSGAYNRTLTPFSFQAEDRNFWDAKSTYQTMAPFNYAEQIKDALLLIHGQDDSNSGTFPIQSERMYQAVQGLGGISRLVMLPAEDHGYRARESVLHMLWEQDQWLERYVRNAKPRTDEVKR
ncbi:alpha/beta hydrolase family protein [Parachitinimonas caeni]|uniref:Prolyl oligopeptidase family serine peptidase n=1 Tax=Parachitinimonas caeni TaxID=3031301 RepID=A0ABT7E1P9_9NEIS|nr:prolyl oligopeptidase family serine peptidase [Parachitinimonas caeni]MDK2126179.1 prolyl oligopeptidase family serine peptidase [Parachitinimonas caeni]